MSEKRGVAKHTYLFRMRDDRKNDGDQTIVFTSLSFSIQSYNVKIERSNLAATYSPLASTIGARELNFRVRNENGCFPSAEPPD